MEDFIALFETSKDFLQALLVGFAILMVRPSIIFLIVPFLSTGVISGALQLTMTFALVLPLAPMIIPTFIENPPGNSHLMLILLKEAMIGMVFGLIAGIPFWIAEGVGFIVDNQRGTSMASVFNPLSGESTSPLGVLLNIASTALFFVSGCFIVFLSVFYGSYLLWPIDAVLPHFDERFINYFLGIGDHLLRSIVLYASPMLVVMFLSDLGLGLMNRFAQQLNVFTISMPVKSGLALFILSLYVTILFGFFKDEFMSTFVLLRELKFVLQ